MQNKKHKLVNSIYIFILFLIPTSINAETENIDIVLGKFLNRTVESLIFIPTQGIYVFRNDTINLGWTVIPNPFKNLRPVGSLDFIQIPGRVLVNFSNYVFEEVGR